MLSWEEGKANIPLLGQGRLEVWEWMYGSQNCKKKAADIGGIKLSGNA